MAIEYWIGASVTELVNLYHNSGPFTAIDPTGRDLGKVVGIADLSDPNMLWIKIDLEDGSKHDYSRAAFPWSQTDPCFTIIFDPPTTDEIKPDGDYDKRVYNDLPVDGGITSRVRILSNRVAEPSNDAQVLAITLIDHGAREHNLAILERAVANRIADAENCEAKQRAAKDRVVRVNEGFILDTNAILEMLFGGNARSIKPVFGKMPHGQLLLTEVEVTLEDGGRVTLKIGEGGRHLVLEKS